MRRTDEEYIEVIYELAKGHGDAHTTDIASRLNVKPASVTEMLRKLSEKGYVNYEPYKGASLTKKGDRIAKDLARRHKTLADFLAILGVEPGVAERDACKIEHEATPETMEQLHKFVDFVQSGEHEPKWLEKFKEFSETGKRPKCKKARGSKK